MRSLKKLFVTPLGDMTNAQRLVVLLLFFLTLISIIVVVFYILDGFIGSGAYRPSPAVTVVSVVYLLLSALLVILGPKSSR